MKKKAVVQDVKAFHHAVNVIFHNHEAAHYDSVHTEMWESLPHQYNLVARSLANYIKGDKLSLLDIGCGTGLATQMLLDTAIGPHIAQVNLADTSTEMLKLAIKRSAQWDKKVNVIKQDLDEVTEKYDIIIVSSVLHHIPDLKAFFETISRLQQPGGIFISIHDPLADAIKSDVYEQRNQEYQSYLNSKPATRKPPLITRAYNKFKRTLFPSDYIRAVNKELLRQKIISSPLTAHEIWSITDIHVESLPYSASDGISKQFMVDALNDYSLLSFDTYAFFGTLISNVDEVYQEKEKQLSLNKDQFGRNFSSVWLKN